MGLYPASVICEIVNKAGSMNTVDVDARIVLYETRHLTPAIGRHGAPNNGGKGILTGTCKADGTL